jgi:hypothetical protein
MRHEASGATADLPADAPRPETAGDIMTTDIVSVPVGTCVRDVALLLLEAPFPCSPPTSDWSEWLAKAICSVATMPIGLRGATGGWRC